MSSSRAIKPKRDDTVLTNWVSMPERAPSIEREETPIFARVVALGGLFFVVLGTLAALAPNWQTRTIISPGLGLGLALAGLCPILYHAFVERDLQFRRLYGFLGLALILAGIVFRMMAFKGGYGHWFFLFGVPGLSIGLVFLVAIIRNEPEAQFRALVLNFVGIVGGVMILFTAVLSFRDADSLAGEGAILLLLALFYAGTYIGQQETDSQNGYYAALGLGSVGVLGVTAGLIRSLMPESTFLIPGGLILMGMSLVYISFAIGACTDWPVVIIARRELAAFFYSPIAYLVLIGLLLIGWFMFFWFVGEIIDSAGPRAQPMFEPIIGRYVFGIFPVIVQIFVVPVMTMRLFSEEQRTGTLEVLMTAPVNEISVVLGKFLAAWIFYMLSWLPWWLFLVALRYVGGEEFDYRPALSFTAALAVISAGLLSMGLFFSSLTSNQIIAAVLTFVGMIMHLALYFLKWSQFVQEGSPVYETLTYLNFFDLWLDSLRGVVAPRFLVFHLSVAVFFFFATVKMLESRKWR
ncbi:MAG: ABC transporter permease [Planctomycetes bacterium]|nr:ABC transporter permease [Planctomycetota bacterium]